jgi:hypothetical protein
MSVTITGLVQPAAPVNFYAVRRYDVGTGMEIPSKSNYPSLVGDSTTNGFAGKIFFILRAERQF